MPIYLRGGLAENLFLPTRGKGGGAKKSKNPAYIVYGSLMQNINLSIHPLGTLFVICFANYWFVFVVIPIMVMYYFLQKFYVTTARQVKRMESITRSPIYRFWGLFIFGLFSHFSVVNTYSACHFCFNKNLSMEKCKGTLR